MNYFQPLSKEELHEIFDEKAIQILDFYLKRGELVQPEQLNLNEKISYKIPPEHLEIWFSQALGWHSIGAGSYPIDIISPDKSSGADVVKVVYKVKKDKSISHSHTNEKSIFQKFGDSNWSDDEAEETLDEMFVKKNLKGIGISANDIFYKKINSITGLHNLYYFYFLFPPAGVNNVYICGLKINKNEKIPIENLELTKEKQSVIIHDFIDSKYGQTKVYKSKKRFELRLYAHKFIETNKVIKFSINNTVKQNNLREFENLNLKDFLNKIFN